MPSNTWRGKSEWVLAQAKDGSEIVVRQNSNHFQGVDSILISEAIEALDQSQLPEQGLQTFTHNFGEQVGWVEIVETSQDDYVFYAPRTDSSGRARHDNRTKKVRWTRWVQGVEKPKAYEITFALMRTETAGRKLVLIFACYGGQIRLEPGDPRATNEDRRWARLNLCRGTT